MTLQQLLQYWRQERTISNHIVEWRTTDPVNSVEVTFPTELHPILASALMDRGIQRLYVHQMEAWKHANQGHNLVITTGTASGKTLCYNLPILNAILTTPALKALYIYPTKALSQDQLTSLSGLISSMAKFSTPGKNIPDLIPGIYDGDTPPQLRTQMRKNTNLLISNPDMLHVAILPHHTLWANFFRSLRFIIIDEIHMYRGVFGSHIANLLRRFLRIAHFYGANTQFILTSATIANPLELGESLIGSVCHLIDNDGAPRNRRHIILYNPPVIEQNTGIRRSASAEALRIAGDLLDYKVQTLIFTKTRRAVEIAVRSISQQQARHKMAIHGYRSGYLPAERRRIEGELREGRARLVVATNALELGIDIGDINAVLIIGYPGSIAAFRQQIGRAGRRLKDSLAVMVASGSPLDQFLLKHPEFLFEKSPEQALINPDNLLILLQHIRCAAFELPFQAYEGFGSAPRDLIMQLLDFLALNGLLHHSPGGSYHWVADKYPAQGISLRRTSDQSVTLELVEGDKTSILGEVDLLSSYWMVHPQAVYLHEGQSYIIEELNLEQKTARLTACDYDYYTEAHSDVEIDNISENDRRDIPGGVISFNEIQVTIKVTGYRKIRWFNREILGMYSLDMPATQLRTQAIFLSLTESSLVRLRELGSWSVDPNDYGPDWNSLRLKVRVRDLHTCKSCGMLEGKTAHHVHHIIPFRSYSTPELANRLENLITLCPVCHQQAEERVHIRSGLAGLGYAFHNLSPLDLMCDSSDIGIHTDPRSKLTADLPVVVIYDQIPDGIGLSENLYQNISRLFERTVAVIDTCSCESGCPGCVGPAAENGIGGKKEARDILRVLGFAQSQKGVD